MPQRLPGVRSLVAGSCFVASLLTAPSAAQFTSFSGDSRNILEGSWLSCRDDDGRYAERVYDHIVNGVGKFEVHLGPRDEFAVFEGVQEMHREHAASLNLLMPYRVPTEGGRAKRRWEIPALGLAFTVTLAGGSRADCESWFIVLARLQRATH